MSSRPSRRPGGTVVARTGSKATSVSSSASGGRGARRAGARSKRVSVQGPPSASDTASGRPRKTRSGPLANGLEGDPEAAPRRSATVNIASVDSKPSLHSDGNGGRGAQRGDAGETKAEEPAMSLAERNRQAAIRKRTEKAAASKLRQRRKKISKFQRFRRRYLRCGTRGLRDMDVPISEEAVQACEAIYLTPRDISRIKSAFDAVDIDGSGEIDRMEMFEYLEEVRSPFSEGVFQLAGDETTKKVLIPFNDFLLIVVRYCMFSKEDILRFTFNLFDLDNSGALEEDEFIQLAHVVNGKNPTFPGNFSRALEEFDTNDDGQIDFDEFRMVNRRFPMMLFPAFRLQDNFRKKTLGNKGWNRVMRTVARAEALVEYRKSHDGALPHESRGVKIRRKLFGCLIYDPDPEKLVKLHESAVARQEAARQAEATDEELAEGNFGEPARIGFGGAATPDDSASDMSPTPTAKGRRNQGRRGGRRSRT